MGPLTLIRAGGPGAHNPNQGWAPRAGGWGPITLIRARVRASGSVGWRPPTLIRVRVRGCKALTVWRL